MKKFEIYFHDLRDEAQERFLEFQGIDDPSEINADYVPICVLEKEEGDEI